MIQSMYRIINASFKFFLRSAFTPVDSSQSQIVNPGIQAHNNLRLDNHIIDKELFSLLWNQIKGQDFPVIKLLESPDSVHRSFPVIVNEIIRTFKVIQSLILDIFLLKFFASDDFHQFQRNSF